MIAPTTNRVTQGKHGQYNAVDYSASPDATIYAPEDGKITAYGPSGTCGNRLELTAGSNRHGFCHLEKALVAAGTYVKKGQPIGIMGYTGYTIPEGPAGRHLHWVIYRNGVYVYPPSLVNETIRKDIMDTDAKVRAQYYTLRGSEGTDAERKGWVGRTYEEFNATARAEVAGREAHRRNLESAVATLTKERDAARAEVVKIGKELLGLRDQNKILEAKVTEKDAEITGLKETIKKQEEQKQAQIDELNKVIKIKDDEITRLTKELNNCTQTNDCANLSGWQLIAAGIKKLLGKGVK